MAFRESSVPAGNVHRFVKLIWRSVNTEMWSQEELERRSGVSVSAVRKWRRGVRSPRLIEIEAVLNTLGYELVARLKDE